LRGLLLLTAHHRSCVKNGWIISTVPANMTRSNNAMPHGEMALKQGFTGA
jgi:hypothetical protein